MGRNRVFGFTFVGLSVCCLATTEPVVAAPSADDDAGVGGVEIPDSMRSGDRARLRIVMKNRGTATWDRDFRLGVVGDGAGDAARFIGPTGAPATRVHLPPGLTVPPGG